MITTFHSICIIARCVYTLLSESLSSRSQGNAINEESPEANKYEIDNHCSIEEGYGLKFIPQLYVQRYQSVKAVLEDIKWRGSIRKVVEFGCAEFGFFPYLKRLAGVQEVLEVDINQEVLEQHQCKVSPLNSDYVCQREEPLNVYVLQGNIAHSDEYLIGCDAVVCIELIEHLYPDVLEEVPYTVFGFIKPRVAIFTTPNGEFNVLFPNFQGFRHPDHKFEWTREQFKSWANNIVLRYTDYIVSLHGIGWGPSGTENLGSCSQMAVFEKRSLQPLGVSDKSEITDPAKDDLNSNSDLKYHLLRKWEYPFHKDTRTDKEKICDQVVYAIYSLSYQDEFLEDHQKHIPLYRILPFVSNWISSAKELEEIMKQAGWEIVTKETGQVAVVCPIDSSSCFSDEHEDFDCHTAPSQEGQNHQQNYTWDNFESCSEEKWDCDSDNQNLWNEDHESLVENHNFPPFAVGSNDTENKEYLPSISGCSQSCVDVLLKYENGYSSPTSVNGKQELQENIAFTFKPSCDVENNDRNSDIDHVDLHLQDSVHTFRNICNAPVSSICKMCDISKPENLSEEYEKNNSCVKVSTESSSSGLLLSNISDIHSGPLGSLNMITDSEDCESFCYSNIHMDSQKSSSCNNLYLNLPAEVLDTVTESTKKVEGPTDSPLAVSVSPEEPNDRLADSGYPNSTSALDMELDLTPEQVDELFTENDIVSEHPLDHNCDSISISSHDSDSDSEPQQIHHPHPVLMPQPDVLFEEAMNVENGDVANNNRDGEGNNVLAVGALRNENVADGGADNVAAGIVLPENFDDLIAAAEDLDNDNAFEINVVEPFPHWLLNLLGLANGGGGGAMEGDGVDILQQESSDEEDSDNNDIIDEGLGDEYNIDCCSLSDSCPSEAGHEFDVGGEISAANV